MSTFVRSVKTTIGIINGSLVELNNMKTQSLLNNHNAGKWALNLSRLMPPRLGKWVVRVIATGIATQKDLPVVQGVRANQWVVSGERLDATALEKQVSRVFNHAGLSFYNLFHNIHKPNELQSLVVFSPMSEEIIQRSKENRFGLIVAGIHISNFDLVAQAAALRGLKAFALSLPDPDEAVQWQHNLRRRSGLEILDASLPNLRLAIQRLEQGQTAVTGIDRPVPNPKIKPIFFNRPAHLAVHHIQLAIRAKVPVIVMSAAMMSDGRYHISSSEEISMRPYSDRHKELKLNAEHVLEVAQEMIIASLDQWVVFQPVWPEVLPLVPQ
jgi:lauroyl/myristoyl acyltransferase